MFQTLLPHWYPAGKGLLNIFPLEETQNQEVCTIPAFAFHFFIRYFAFVFLNFPLVSSSE